MKKRRRRIVMKPPRVLVIDDSPSTCLFIATTLEQAGYVVDFALNGREGFTKFMRFMPDCLILDVLLPDTNGYELCRYIRQDARWQRLPLILISSKNAPLDVMYGLRQGADRYLPKPFTSEALIQEVWEVFPDPLRSTSHHAIPAIQSQARQTPPAVLKLIPRKVLNQDAMRTSNPFANGPNIKDKYACRLLAEIDGKKTVSRLATVTGLSTEEVVSALRVLLKAKSVQLYDKEGQPVADMV
jgi:chemotaxis family two-component system response regulator PixH